MKKKFQAFAIVALVASLTSCGGNTTSEEVSVDYGDDGKIVFKDVELSFWHPITGSDYTNLSMMIGQFNKEYEGKIHVKDTQGSNDQSVYYNNFELSVSRNRGPDVAIIHNNKVLTYSGKKIGAGKHKGEPQYLSPIQPIIDEANAKVENIKIEPEMYIKGAWDNINVNDNLWGVPLDVHTCGIFYNKALLEQYNISVPTNRAELIAACQKVQKESGTDANGNPKIWGMPMSYASLPQQFMANTSYIQNGGKAVLKEGDEGFDNNLKFKTSDGREKLITSQPGFRQNNVGAKSTRMVSDLIYKDKISNHSVGLDANLTSFKNGTALFCIDGLWNTNEFKDQFGPDGFGVLPLSGMFASDPTSEDANKIYCISHDFVIPRGNNFARGSKIHGQAALEFIKWMGEHSIEWAKSGQIPAYNAVRQSEEYKALKFNEQFGDPSNFVIAQADSYYEQAYGPFQKCSTAAMSSEADLTDAELTATLDDIYSECISSLKTAFKQNTID